jgi:hypothetical protein
MGRKGIGVMSVMIKAAVVEAEHDYSEQRLDCMHVKRHVVLGMCANVQRLMLCHEEERSTAEHVEGAYSHH